MPATYHRCIVSENVDRINVVTREKFINRFFDEFAWRKHGVFFIKTKLVKHYDLVSRSSYFPIADNRLLATDGY